MKQMKQDKEKYKSVFARRKILSEVRQAVRKYYEENKEEIQTRSKLIRKSWEQLLQDCPELAEVTVFAGPVEDMQK